MRDGALDEEYVGQIAAAFGIKRDRVLAHQWVDNGPGWAVVQLPTAGEVLALEPDLSVIPTAMVGAIGAYPDGSEHAFEVLGVLACFPLLPVSQAAKCRPQNCQFCTQCAGTITAHTAR